MEPPPQPASTALRDGSFPELATLLAALDRALIRERVPRAARRELAAEVAHDLAAAAAERLARRAAGESAAEVRRRVVREFGAPGIVARDWARADRAQPPRLAWSLASVAGAVVGLAAGGPLGAAAGRLAGVEWPVLPVTGLVLGSAIGLAQWGVLRRRRAGLALWAPASGVAVAAALTGATWLVERVGFVKGVLWHEATALLLLGAAIGGAIGALQLAATAGPRGAARWILLNAAALAAALPLAGLLALTAPGGFRTPQGQLLLVFLAASALGLGTASGLAKLPIGTRRAVRD